MKRGTHNHPKVWITCKLVGVRRPTLLGHLELLWDFTTQYAPAGDVGRYPDDRIEAAMDWSGRRGRLLDGLVQGGWVERHPTYRLVIHDWHEHCNESVKKVLSRRGEQFVALSSGYRESVETLSGQCLPKSASVAENGSLPKPLPLPLPLPKPQPLSAGSSPADVQAETAGPAKRAKPKPSGMTQEQKAWFSEWWEIYWRHVSRKTAEDSFARKVQDENRFAVVMASTRAQLPGMMARPADKRPHGSTWLNQERWTDEAEPTSTALAPAGNGKRPMTFGEIKERRQSEIFDRMLAYELENRK